MMTNPARCLKLLTFTAVLVLGSAVAVPHARAASVSLLPTSAVSGLNPGDLVTFDVFIDFSDVGGALGGGFDVTWDPAALGFVDLTSAGLGDPGLGRDPDVLDGLLESWAVADFFSGIFSGLVGSLRFEVLPGMGLTSFIALAPTGGIGGPWVSNVDFVTLLQPEYNAVELTRAPAVIPLPPALWLFATSLAAIAGFLRKRNKAGW